MGKTARGKIRNALGDRLFMAADYLILSLATLLVLYPLVYVVSSSFSSPAAVMSGRVWLWPVDFSLAGYQSVFKNNQVMVGYMNTVLYTVCATALGVTLSVMAAFPLSRKNVLVGCRAFNSYIVFTMLFSGGMVPTYLLIKDLGMLNKRLALIIPGAVSAYNIIIARTFFVNSIPDDLYEAATLDGCGDAHFLWTIVLPLSKAILAVLTLFYAVGHWNSYMPALLYIRKAALFPLQIVLRNILIMSSYSAEMVADVQSEIAMQGMEALLKYALIVVGSAPILMLYPFVQRYFVTGVMIGSLKG